MTTALLLAGGANASQAGLSEDMALCRQSWWGVAQRTACSRVLEYPNAADMTRAEALLQRARFGEAKSDVLLKDYDEAVRLAPLHPDPIFERGTFRARSGDTSRALADVSEAIKLAPTSFAYNTRANLYEKTGDSENAIADLTSAITLDTEFSIGLQQRGQLHLKRGDVTKAIEDFDRLLSAPKENIRHSLALTGKAEAWLAGKQFDKAIADATAALKQNARLPTANKVLVEALLASGKTTEAKALIDKTFSKDIKDPGALRLQALAAFQAGDAETASRTIAMAQLIAPDDAKTKSLAADIGAFAKQQNLAAPFADTSKAYSICLASNAKGMDVLACDDLIKNDTFPNQRKAYPHAIRGRFLYFLGAHKRAAEDLETAITLGQRSDANYAFLGFAYKSLGQFDRAIASYTSLMQQRTLSADMRANMALLLEQNHECAEALAMLATPAMQEAEKNSHGVKARCHEALGQHAKAIASFEIQAQLETKPAMKAFGLIAAGKNAAALGDFASAAKWMERAVALIPGDQNTRMTHAEALMMAGDAKAALAVFAQLLTERPADSNVLSRRAMAHLQLGNLAAALADTNAAVNSPGAGPNTFLTRATVLLAQGNRTAALDDIEAVLKKRPHDFQALDLKGQILAP